ncbi:hypothetical protein LOAG_03981 [Loa loa]|nr:hypothetical protein LOAG_03981 [Loa loa]EFO24500.2 hypothetical protein LOAG_03981 [Loa loa]
MPAEIACGIIVNSFNGLTVGSNELNGIGNEIINSVDYNSDPEHVSSILRDVFTQSAASSIPVSSSVVINSFQGNVVGANSLQNNAGVSLIPTRSIGISGNSRINEWELFRIRMRIWAAQLQARYRLVSVYYQW